MYKGIPGPLLIRLITQTHIMCGKDSQFSNSFKQLCWQPGRSTHILPEGTYLPLSLSVMPFMSINDALYFAVTGSKFLGPLLIVVLAEGHSICTKGPFTFAMIITLATFLQCYKTCKRPSCSVSVSPKPSSTQ